MKLFKIMVFCLVPLISTADKLDEKTQNFINNRLHGIEYTGDVKCATRYMFHLCEMADKVEPGFNKLTKLFFEPDTSRQRSMISPGGHFRLSWDESGPHAVPAQDISGNGIPDFMDSAFVIFDHVWAVEVVQMGYNAPPSLDGTPVQIYNVYFSNIPYYGLTIPDEKVPVLPGNSFTSYIEVHNNFSGFYSPGLAGLKVTAAHEFHHAIQMGYDFKYETQDFSFYEMTSTWIENQLYPDIKDYYQYLGSFFREVSNTNFDFYNRTTLFPYGNSLYIQMIENQFGSDIVRQIWEEFPFVNLGMDAIISTLQQSPYNTPWQESLNEYGLWLYYTGDRAITGRYFTDAADFPQIRVLTSDKVVFTGEYEESRDIKGLANRYLEFYDLINLEMTIFTSTQAGSNGGFRWMTPVEESGFLSLNKAFADQKFTSNEVVFLISNATRSDNSYILSVSQPDLNEIAISQNPVRITEDNQEVQFKVPQNSEIYIFTVSGYLVARMDKDASQIRSWNLKNQQGDPVASGVYLWLVKSGNVEKLNKFTIIRN